MSTSITFPQPDGATFIIPAVDDENWGQNVSNFLIAIPNGVPPRNGTFSLTGDLYFGPSFGLVSQYYKSPTSNIATAGILRLAKTDLIDWRNNANSGNLALGINGSDQLTFNGAVVSGNGTVNSGTANHITYYPASTNAVSAAANITINDGTGAMTMNHLVVNTDIAITNVTISAPSGTYSWTLPTAQGTANSLLLNDGTGTLSWKKGLAGTSTFSGGTVTPDAGVSSLSTVIVDAPTTVNGPTGGFDTQKYILRLKQDSTGHTVTLSTGVGGFRFGTDITSFTASGANKTDYVGAIYDSSANRWDVVSVIQGF